MYPGFSADPSERAPNLGRCGMWGPLGVRGLRGLGASAWASDSMRLVAACVDVCCAFAPSPSLPLSCPAMPFSPPSLILTAGPPRDKGSDEPRSWSAKSMKMVGMAATLPRGPLNHPLPCFPSAPLGTSRSRCCSDATVHKAAQGTAIRTSVSHMRGYYSAGAEGSGETKGLP